jgi:hypothetical protein
LREVVKWYPRRASRGRAFVAMQGGRRRHCTPPHVPCHAGRIVGTALIRLRKGRTCRSWLPVRITAAPGLPSPMRCTRIGATHQITSRRHAAANCRPPTRCRDGGSLAPGAAARAIDGAAATLCTTGANRSAAGPSTEYPARPCRHEPTDKVGDTRLLRPKKRPRIGRQSSATVAGRSRPLQCMVLITTIPATTSTMPQISRRATCSTKNRRDRT